MYSSGTFQDLINLDTTNENIEDVINDLKALEEEVADNKLDINANTLAISNNTTAISNNGVLINNNTTNILNNANNIGVHTLDIALNANNIINNTTSILQNTSSININNGLIAGNTTSIVNLNNTVLLRDGSIPLDIGYSPTNTQDIATKDYVDSHSTSTAYLRVDGSNSMLGDLQLNNNAIRLDALNSIFALSNNIDITAQNNTQLENGGSFSLITSPTQVDIFRNLSMVSNNIFGVNDLSTVTINTVNFNTLVSDVATNTTDISNLDNNKVNKSGDTMTGNLDMNNYAIVNAVLLRVETIEGKLDTPLNFYYGKTTGPTTSLYYKMIEFPDETEVDIYRTLDMNNNDITNIGVNGYNLTNDFLLKSGGIMSGDLDMNNHTIKKVQTIQNDLSLYTDIKFNMRGGGQLPVTKDVFTFDAENVFVNDFLMHCHIPAQFDDRVNVTHQIDALRFATNLSVFGNTIGQYTGSAPVNGLQVKGYDSGALSTSRYDGGNVGVRDSLTWDEYGDINVRRNITLGGTIDGIDLQTLNSSVSTNANNISTNSSNISTNSTALTQKLDISSSTSLQVDTPEFVINGGQNGCALYLKADTLNNNDSFTPKIIFEQDGTVETSAIFNGDNQLNISNSASANGAIYFRTGTTNNGWSTAPIRMYIANSGDVVINTNLRINSYKNTNISSFRYYAYGGYGGYSSGTINISLNCPNGRVVAHEFDATSDRRCKTDIQDLPDDKVDAFMKLEAKQYYWKDEKDNLKYGFIAQDVIKEDIMPCVNFAESDDMKGGIDEITGVNNPEGICINLNYDSMIPLLQKALKKALDRIDILEQKINTLI